MNLTVTNSELNLGAREQINWITLITLATFHSLAVVALFHISWSAVAVAAILHWLCTGCGIGMGYHRLHTHRSYKVPRVVEHALAILATIATILMTIPFIVLLKKTHLVAKSVS